MWVRLTKKKLVWDKIVYKELSNLVSEKCHKS